jgi:glycosyltransferase involved in cell wall biosynthesis
MTVRGSVLLVTPRWTRDGGVATHVVSSATELARRGLDVHVLAARLELEEEIEGVTLHRSPELFNANAPVQVRIGTAGSLRPDVIHSHQFEDPDVLAALGQQAPVAVSVHGYSACASGVHYFRPGHECTRAHGPGCLPNLTLRGCAHTRTPTAIPAAYRRAGRRLRALQASDLVISYSSVVDAHLEAAGLPRRARVPLFPTIPPHTAGGHDERRRVVFAGRIVAPKGVDVLIRCAREVAAEFLICGTGRQLEAMRRLASRTGVGERVRFAGWLGANDLATQLAEASVLAMPSRWPEPAGLVGLEAQAAGRPVVASDTGGVRDWLQDGVNGLYVTPGDPRALAQALNELLGDPARQQALGEAGRRIVSERYTPARHVEALLEAYGRAHENWSQRRGAPASSATGRPQAAGVRT